MKILYSIYAKVYLEPVAASATQMNAEERTQLLRHLKDFEDLFDVTLGDRDKDPIELQYGL